MNTSETVYLGNLRTESTHIQSGSKIVTDAPVDNHGNGDFFSPTDLLATSLGCCMLTIAGRSATVHGFNVDGATVKTTKIMGTNPRRVVEIIVELTFPHNNYSDKERLIIEKSVKECPVANSLHPDLKQSISFTYKD
ncbi:MAG: OsmC family protein [Prevotellaceae bacterium]|jgi:uncharacterized OsmC-like protein|nr:OsmC family protein [Prevotellaceae bacterium]